MGGAIAMRLAAKFPRAFTSLCLIDTAGAESEKGWLQQEMARTGTNPMMEISSVSDYKIMMKIGMSKPPYIPSIFLPLLAEKRINRKNQDAHVMRDILDDLDQREILQKLNFPTLVIWGALDKIMHVNDVKLLTQHIRGSQSFVIPDVGHVPMVEAPALTAQAYLNFLNGILAMGNTGQRDA
jgi:pimeloyl-ACP methyl ester carboxylesterase